MTRWALIIESPFDDDIAFAVKFVGEETGVVLSPEEMSALSPSAVKKRKTQFILGRLAAHEALTSLLGPSDYVVRKGVGGQPLWPPRIVGAITHTSDMAMAAVARIENAAGIGLDMELLDRKVSLGIAKHVCRPKEREWVNGTEEFLGFAEKECDSYMRLMMLFCAKESVFKAFYPTEEIFLDFADAELIWMPSAKKFLGRLEKAAGANYPVGYTFEVGCRFIGSNVLTFVRLPLLKPLFL